MPQPPPPARFITAGLGGTLKEAQVPGEEQSSFLLVPEGEEAAAEDAPPHRRPEAELPRVWQDLFGCITRAASAEYLCSLASTTQQQPAPGGEAPPAPAPEPPPEHAITHDSAFTRFLCPETLVRRHRLGPGEVRRLFRTLQAFSLGFHQSIVELSAHARDRGLLLLAVWRSYAMLWDSALQVAFPSEVVQLSRERQAAIMTSEHLLGLLEEADATAAAADAAAVAARAAAEAASVEALGVRADAAAALQRTAQLEQDVRDLQRDKAALAAQLEAQRQEAGVLSRRLQDTARPLSSATLQAGTQPDGALAVATKQAAAALTARQAALQQLGAEVQCREAAEQAVRELRAQLAQAAAAQAEQQQLQEQLAALEGAHEELGRCEARLESAHEETGRWRARAVAVEAEAAQLRQQLAAAQQKSEDLVDALLPLSTRIKVLEAQLAAHLPG